MVKKPRIPVVAAYAVITGKSYESLEREFLTATPEEQLSTDDVYNRDNMGYGMEAWQAYLAADAEQRAFKEETGEPTWFESCLARQNASSDSQPA